MKKIVLAILMFCAAPMAFADSVSGGVELNRQVAIQFTKDVNVADYHSFSFQVDFGTVTPNTIQLTDGNFSSDTIRLASFAALQGTRSSATITLTSGNNTALALTGASITIKGKAFTEGVDWVRGFSSTNTAANIKTAIDAFNSEYSATVSSNIVTVVADSSGTFANSWTIASSTPTALAVSSTNFGNGQDYGYLSINGTTLTEGTDWRAITSSAATAISIKDAINANSTLSAIITASTPTAGVVLMVSNLSGVNQYPLSVSNVSAMVPSAQYFFGGAVSSFTVSTDAISKVAHGLPAGLKVLFTKTTGTAPTGLVSGTTYFVLANGDDSFKLSASSSTAGVGAAVDITALTGGGQFTIAPLAFSAGSAGFDWKGSNDGTTFYSLFPTISSATISVAGGQLFSFVDYTYKYVRFNFTAPTAGSISLNLVSNGIKR